MPKTQRSVVWASWLVGHEVIADLDDGALGIDDAEIEDGAHLDRDVVAGNHVLRRNFVDHDAQIDAHHLLHERHQQKQPGTLGPGVAAEGEDHAALVFAQDANGGVDEDQQQSGDDDDGCENHGCAPCWD